MSAFKGCATSFRNKEPKCKPNMCLHLHFCTMASLLASYRLFSKEICWSSRKSVILRRQLNKNKKLTMRQRRMNIRTTELNRGIKSLGVLSSVHAPGIGSSDRIQNNFRRTFDRLSGIR